MFTEDFINNIPDAYSPEQRARFYALIGNLSAMTGELRLELSDFVVLAEVARGDIEGRPWHATALAGHLKLPRETVARKLAGLVERRFVRREVRGRRVVFLRSAPGIRMFTPLAGRMIERVVRYVRRHHGAAPGGG